MNFESSVHLIIQNWTFAIFAFKKKVQVKPSDTFWALITSPNLITVLTFS